MGGVRDPSLNGPLRDPSLYDFKFLVSRQQRERSRSHLRGGPIPPYILGFGLLCHHTVSNPITSGTRTSGAQ